MAILSAALFAGLLASAAQAKVFDRAPGGLPSNWRFARSPEPGQSIKLRIALRSENADQFEQKLLQVSTPDHPEYGNHLQAHEVRALLAPSAAATNSVLGWLETAGVQDIEDDGDWVSFRTNVTTANSLLETEFGWFHNQDSGRDYLRTLQYGVPEDVAAHISLVQPTTRFGNMKQMRSSIVDSTPLQEMGELAANELGNINIATTGGDIPASCNTTITPTCLLKLYNVHYGPKAITQDSVAFASFLEEYARYADLAAWEPKFAPWAVGHNFSTVTFNGGLDDQTSPADSGEANLDAQTIAGISAPIRQIQYSTAGRAPLVPDLDQPTPPGDNEPYLEYLIGLSKVPNDKLPQTISHSYGEDEQSLPREYVLKVCSMFGELGARGVTVIFSSGDNGVGSACLSNDGKNTTEFQPQFPAICPTVTSVGGTQYIKPEQAVSFSSGGFSRIYQTPIWQQAAIARYAPYADPRFKKYYDIRGRGFPDVAAQSVGFAIQDKGVLKKYRGTSCAAPAFAGVIALLNNARIATGQRPFGFINPWLYTVAALGSGFNDITTGYSTGCDGKARFNGPPNGSPVIPDARFAAVPGWDPVTGLGTPDFGNLLRLSTPWVQNRGGPVQ